MFQLTGNNSDNRARYFISVSPEGDDVKHKRTKPKPLPKEMERLQGNGKLRID